MGIQPLPVGMGRVGEVALRLFKDGQRRHQPDYHAGLAGRFRRHHIQDRLEGIGSQEGLAAGGRHLDADMGHTGHIVLVPFHFGGAPVIPVVAKGTPDILEFVQIAEEVGQILDDAALIVFQFHGCPVRSA